MFLASYLYENALRKRDQNTSYKTFFDGLVQLPGQIDLSDSADEILRKAGNFAERSAIKKALDEIAQGSQDNYRSLMQRIDGQNNSLKGVLDRHASEMKALASRMNELVQEKDRAVKINAIERQFAEARTAGYLISRFAGLIDADFGRKASSFFNSGTQIAEDVTKFEAGAITAGAMAGGIVEAALSLGGMLLPGSSDSAAVKAFRQIQQELQQLGNKIDAHFARVEQMLDVLDENLISNFQLVFDKLRPMQFDLIYIKDQLQKISQQLIQQSYQDRRNLMGATRLTATLA